MVADKRMRLTKVFPNLPVLGLTSISTSVQIQAVGRIHYCESPHENWDGNVRELCNINLGIESGIRGGFCGGGVRFFSGSYPHQVSFRRPRRLIIRILHNDRGISHQANLVSRRGRGSGMYGQSITKQSRESEANSPARAKPSQRKLRKPSWTEFVRLAQYHLTIQPRSIRFS